MWFNSLVDSAGGQIITGGNKVVIGHSAEVAASIMHELATSPAADPSLNVAMEELERHDVRPGWRRVRDQLPIHLGFGQEDRPLGRQGDGTTRCSRR